MHEISGPLADALLSFIDFERPRKLAAAITDTLSRIDGRELGDDGEIITARLNAALTALERRKTPSTYITATKATGAAIMALRTARL